MKKLVCKIFTIAIIGFLLSSSAMALNIRDLDDLEFQKVSIREKNSFIDSELDPRRLDILDRLKGSQRPEQAELRCRPLKGLNRVVLNSEFGNFKGKGDIRDLNDFGVKTNVAIKKKFEKLGIKIEPCIEENRNLPVVFVQGFLVNQNRDHSFVILTIQEKYSCVRDPKQIYDLMNFQLERYGRDTDSKGKDPSEIVESVLDRFEYFWKLANKPEK